jgi:RNA polymerase sigma-70 factor (ECF subfamily)
VKTWIFRILKNLARTRGVRERRMVPFSSVGRSGEERPQTLDPAALGPQQRWLPHLRPWSALCPEQSVVSREVMDLVLRELRDLPDLQRQVVALRDVYCWSAEEVCRRLRVSDTYQRVLLHRGRRRVRRMLEEYFVRSGEPPPGERATLPSRRHR